MADLYQRTCMKCGVHTDCLAYEDSFICYPDCWDKEQVTTKAGYGVTADELVERIKALIPTHPEILNMVHAWSLFEIKDFKCDDLQPSLYQASWALAQAIQKHKDHE